MWRARASERWRCQSNRSSGRKAARLAAWITGLTSLVVAGACGPPSALCNSAGECSEQQICIEGMCRDFCNSSAVCRRAEQCVDGICLPASGTEDAATTDRFNQGGADANAESDVSSRDTDPRDSAMSIDAAVPDAAQPDSRAADTGGADACAANQGQACDRNGYCGASIDCSGACTGGSQAANCPDCGERSCVQGQWSDCEVGGGADCGDNSSCAPDGTCDCDVDVCAGDHCDDGDVWSCQVDAYGCGARGSRVEDCGAASSCGGDPPTCQSTCNGQMCLTGDGSCVDGGLTSQCGVDGESCYDCRGADSCLNYYCLSGGGCSQANKPDGTSCGTNLECQAGSCVSACAPNEGDDCGGTCTCGCGPVAKGRVLCDGGCGLYFNGSCTNICINFC